MSANDSHRRAARQHLIDEAARAQKGAMRRLRRAGLTEAELRIAQEYLNSLLMQLLTKADEVYSAYEDLRNSHPGRTVAHQQLLDTEFARLWYWYKEAIGELMAGAMRHATHTFVQAAHQRQGWFGALWQGVTVSIWLMGLVAGLLLLLAINSTLFSGVVPLSYLVVGGGLVLLLVGWRKVGLSLLGLLLPGSLIGFVILSVVLFSG